MDPDAADPAKLAELRSRLEEIAGRKLDISDQQLLSFSWPIAASTYINKHDLDDDAWTANERILPILPQPFCADSQLLDTSGYSTTGSNGQVVFRLTSFLCGRDNIATFYEPVNLIATPQGTSPVFMTMNHELLPGFDAGPSPDVQITASAWHPNGTPAANVRFYWRCRLPVGTQME
jgi:hypothetical protein